MRRLTHRRSPQAPAEGQQLRRLKPHMGRNCVPEGCRNSHHCSFVDPLRGSLHLACVEPTPHKANSDAALAQLDWLAPPHVSLRICPTQLTNCPRQTCCQAASSTLRPPWAAYSWASSSPQLLLPAGSLHIMAKVGEDFWWWATGASSNCSVSWEDH